MPPATPLFMVLTLLTPGAMPDTPAMTLLRSATVALPGSCLGPALDSVARRLYFPRSSSVAVLDLDGKVVGEVAGIPGIRAVALAPELGIGFTASSRSQTVSVFNLATLVVEKKLRTTGGDPGAIVYDPGSRRIFSFNRDGRNATAFDAFGGAVAASIPLGGRPGAAAGDGLGRLFVALDDTGEVVVLDARRAMVTHRWKIPASPQGLLPAYPVRPALASPVGSAPVSSVGSAPVSSVGSAPVSSVGSAPVSSVGSTPVSSVGSAPASSVGSTLASSVELRSVSSVGPASTSSVGSAPVSSVGVASVASVGSVPISPVVSPAASSVGAPGALGGATRLALDPGRRRLFLTARGRVLAVLDTSTGEPVAMVPLASEATALACDPASGRTYLTGAGGELSVIQGDAAGRFAVANTLPLQAGPCALVLDERTHLLYVPTAGPANGQTFQIQVVGPS